MFKHARVGRGIAYFRTLLDSADPELLNLVQIENMNGLATNLRSHADVYGSTANVEALEGVDNSLNELFNYIRFLPVAPPNRVTSSAEESVRSFSRSAINVLDGIMRRNEMLGDTIAAQDQKIVEQQSKIDEAGRVIESQKSRLDQAISRFFRFSSLCCPGYSFMSYYSAVCCPEFRSPTARKCTG